MELPHVKADARELSQKKPDLKNPLNGGLSYQIIKCLADGREFEIEAHVPDLGTADRCTFKDFHTHLSK